MFARMYNPGGTRRCAVCGPGLGDIPSDARASITIMRSLVQRRAHAATTASAAAWPQARANLEEVLQEAGYYATIGAWPMATTAEYAALRETIRRAEHTYTSQVEARIIVTPEIVINVPSRPPRPRPVTPPPGFPIPGLPIPGDKPAAPPPPGASPPGRTQQAGIGAMLSSPWALAGVLGVGAVVMVWYATSVESPAPKRGKGK